MAIESLACAHENRNLAEISANLAIKINDKGKEKEHKYQSPVIRLATIFVDQGIDGLENHYDIGQNARAICFGLTMIALEEAMIDNTSPLDRLPSQINGVFKKLDKDKKIEVIHYLPISIAKIQAEELKRMRQEAERDFTLDSLFETSGALPQDFATYLRRNDFFLKFPEQKQWERFYLWSAIQQFRPLFKLYCETSILPPQKRESFAEIPQIQRRLNLTPKILLEDSKKTLR